MFPSMPYAMYHLLVATSRTHVDFLQRSVRACWDVVVESDVDATVDADVDAPVDADVDASVDADVDASVDADVDASVDADVDASVDADVDASVDADVDASVVLVEVVVVVVVVGNRVVIPAWWNSRKIICCTPENPTNRGTHCDTRPAEQSQMTSTSTPCKFWQWSKAMSHHVMSQRKVVHVTSLSYHA